MESLRNLKSTTVYLLRVVPDGTKDGKDSSGISTKNKMSQQVLTVKGKGQTKSPASYRHLFLLDCARKVVKTMSVICHQGRWTFSRRTIGFQEVYVVRLVVDGICFGAVSLEHLI